MRMLKWMLIVISCATSSLALADDRDQSDQSDQSGACQDDEIAGEPGPNGIFLTDDKGRSWTDLHVVSRNNSCWKRSPKIDYQTLKNAKLACKALGAQLPQVSHLNDLSEFIGRKYLLSVEAGRPEILPARFMKEKDRFWTWTVIKEDDRFVYNRAIARLSTILKSNDMSKADVDFIPASQDDWKRPFLCMYVAAGEHTDE